MDPSGYDLAFLLAGLLLGWLMGCVSMFFRGDGSWKHRRRHPDRLHVSFVRPALYWRAKNKNIILGDPMSPANAVNQLLSNDAVGINLALAESAAGVAVPLSKGPFAVAVQDPANTVTVTPGSADQTTPTNFKANGSGATGVVTVTVTDQSNGLVGVASFNVLAPPPPPPDKLDVGFVPAS
jgi:hypothetical protein